MLEIIDQSALEVRHIGNRAIELLGRDVKRIEVFGSRGRGHRFAFLGMNRRLFFVSLLYDPGAGKTPAVRCGRLRAWR
jgi:hypothetical protein